MLKYQLPVQDPFVKQNKTLSLPLCSSVFMGAKIDHLNIFIIVKEHWSQEDTPKDNCEEGGQEYSIKEVEVKQRQKVV